MTRWRGATIINGPNFFIVGAAKAGTSALHECLGQHPQIFMTALKEPNFFAPDVQLPYRVEDENSYRSLFEGAAGCSIRGESSASYLISKVAPMRIWQSVPDPRILISLRSPVASFISQHAEARRWGTEKQPDVNRALETFLAASEDARRGSVYDQILRHSDNVARYLDVFGDRVKVLIYEEWISDPRDALGHVLDFLEVDVSFVPAIPVIRRSARFRSSYVQRVVMTPPRLTRRFSTTRVGMRLRSLAMRANVDPKPGPPVDPSLRKAVAELFRDDVERLQSILGRSLIDVWDYV